MRLFPWRLARLAEQVGGEVARECRADLWRRVRRETADMSVPEARGYARAQAAALAAAQVDEALARRSLDTALRARVLESSIDQLVNMAVRDALHEQSPADTRSLAA
jgi:hypothetical protein